MKNGEHRTSAFMGIMGFLLLVGACSKPPQTYVPSVTDSFQARSSDSYHQASQILRADYMFVLNYSSSMEWYLDSLHSNMSTFVSSLQTQGVDYQIGFVNGMIQKNATYSISTDFVSSLILSTSTLATLQNDMNSIMSTVGIPLAPNTNYLLESARQTMDAQHSRFLRNGQLVYVFISDEDDQNSSQNTNYLTELSKYKTDSSYISARSVILGQNTGCNVDPNIHSETDGARLASVAKALDGSSDKSLVVQGLCSNFSQTLTSLAQDISRPTTRFALLAQPVSSTVKIFVNQVELPATGNWSYNASSNEVIFQSSKQPAFNAQLEIRYEIAYTLSNTPRSNTLDVRVNNQSLSNSAWTYIGSENRIDFNESNRPQNGDSVEVIYQAQ